MPECLEFNNSPIVIDHWQRDDTYEGVYPSGARVKDAYFSPNVPAEKCIKPDWRYLFKLSSHRYPWQFWSEIIAYRFGFVIGVEVPPAHVGLSKTYEHGVDTYAALIEWFYDDKKSSYISGGQIMVELIEDFDRSKGEKHNFETMLMYSESNEGFLTYWAKVLTFDTLIGNRDRHQDNWGIIVTETLNQSEVTIDFDSSPAFDNGTALGHEIIEKNISKFDNNRLQCYVSNKRACHHMKWSLKESEPLTFFEFMKKFALAFP